MSLRIVTRGVQAASAVIRDGPSEPLSVQTVDNATSTIDLSKLGPIGGYPTLVLSFEVGGGEKAQGSCEVPLAALPHDRRRGWSELVSTSTDVLAYIMFGEGGNSDTVVLIRSHDTTDWMGELPDDTPLGDITLLGTHESCAFVGFFISQCQQPATPVSQQLADGVRFFDVRLKVNEGELQTYHGIRPEYSTLKAELAQFNAFLRAHPRETIVMFIKEETPPWHDDFSRMVYEVFNETPELWNFSDHIPRLGDVRGRGTLISRFDKRQPDEWPNGMGIRPTTWPNSRQEGFEWDCYGTKVRTIDWYGIDSFLMIPEKVQGCANFLEPTTQPQNGSPLSIAFLSASKFPLAPPQWVAKGMGAPSYGLGFDGCNARMVRWLLQKISENKRPRAVLMTDFYRQTGSGENGFGKLLVAMNFMGV